MWSSFLHIGVFPRDRTQAGRRRGFVGVEAVPLEGTREFDSPVARPTESVLVAAPRALAAAHLDLAEGIEQTDLSVALDEE